MDHLPLPREPKYGLIEAKVYCKDIKDWDHKPAFNDFPAHRGWDVALLKDGKYEQGKDGETADLRSFLQEWLYFRLIQAVFAEVGLDTDLDDLMRETPDGELVIDTRCLIRYFSAVEAHYRRLQKDEKLRALKNCQKHLHLAILFTNRNCSMTSDKRQRDALWPFNETDDLAFMVLGSTLTWAVHRVSTVDPNPPTPDIENVFLLDHKRWGVSKLLFDRMVADGWCLNLMAQLISGDSSILGIYYASLMQFLPSRRDHAECTAKWCDVDQVKDSEYETKHLHPTPTCPAVEPKRRSLLDCLAGGTFPLLRQTRDDPTNNSVQVIPFSPGHRFVAISHVWADGLGNVAGNHLPSCQIDRLITYVSRLYPFTSLHEPVDFWIDTICVPHKDESDDQDYRKLAIERLKDVYEMADKVLVLDSQLLVTSAIASPEENLMRIRLCGWMRRLWTLQEGILAPKVRFQFRERALDPEDLLSSILPEHHQSIWAECYMFFLDLEKDRWRQMHPSMRLAKLWNVLQWRQTSHEEDETICLSILTGRDPSKITSMPKDQRMKNFWSQSKLSPSHVVFMPGPRIQEPGYKWAPSSLMARHRWQAYDFFQESVIPSSGEHTLPVRCLPGTITEKGLICTFGSILLDPLPADMNVFFTIHDQYMDMHYVAVHLYDRTPPEWEDIEYEKLRNPALLLQKWPDKNSAALGILVAEESSSIEIDDSSKAANNPTSLKDRAQILDAESPINVRFICRMYVSFPESVPSNLPTAKHLDPKTGSWRTQFVEGTLCDQRSWCIG